MCFLISQFDGLLAFGIDPKPLQLQDQLQDH
jgi:hypothetical protein